MKKTTTIKIKGMDCTGCEATIRMLLESVEGVNSARVNFKEEKAEVEYDDEKIELPKDLEQILSQTHYRIQ